MTSVDKTLYEKTLNEDGTKCAVILSANGEWSNAIPAADHILENFFIFGTPEFIELLKSGASKDDLAAYVISHLSLTEDGIVTEDDDVVATKEWILYNVADLYITWVPVNAKFEIIPAVYDGTWEYDTIEILDDDK